MGRYNNKLQKADKVKSLVPKLLFFFSFSPRFFFFFLHFPLLIADASLSLFPAI